MSNLPLAHETISALVDELEQAALESDQAAADARDRAAALRAALDHIPSGEAEGNPFHVHISNSDAKQVADTAAGRMKEAI